MKKLMLLATGLVITCVLSAQQTVYGVFAGAQSTTAKYVLHGNEQETGNRFGPWAGFMLKIPFENRLYFTPSVYYSRKGYSVDLKDSSALPGLDVIANELGENTVDLAPLFLIEFSSKPGHLFIQFGPSVDFALSGKETLTLKDKSKVNRPVHYSFTEYGRITASAIGRLGYETSKGWVIAGQYAHGLGSMNNYDWGPSIKHRIFGIMIGKYFSRNPNVIDTRLKE